MIRTCERIRGAGAHLGSGRPPTKPTNKKSFKIPRYFINFLVVCTALWKVGAMPLSAFGTEYTARSKILVLRERQATQEKKEERWQEKTPKRFLRMQRRKTFSCVSKKNSNSSRYNNSKTCKKVANALATTKAAGAAVVTAASAAEAEAASSSSKHTERMEAP